MCRLARYGLVGYLVGRLGRAAGAGATGRCRTVVTAVAGGTAGTCRFMIPKTLCSHKVHNLRAGKSFRDHGRDVGCRGVPGGGRCGLRGWRGARGALAGLRRPRAWHDPPGGSRNASQINGKLSAPNGTSKRSERKRGRARAPRRYGRGGRGGRRLTGPEVTSGSGGGGFSASMARARSTATSSCGSRSAAQSSGVIRTSTSGSTP